MRKIVNYTVVEGCNLKDLRDVVRIALKDGWQPLGRALKTDEPDIQRAYYAQTLVMYEDKKE